MTQLREDEHIPGCDRETMEILKDKSPIELTMIYGKYCGRDKQLLSLKVFGMVLDKKTVMRMIETRVIDEVLLQ